MGTVNVAQFALVVEDFQGAVPPWEYGVPSVALRLQVVEVEPDFVEAPWNSAAHTSGEGGGRFQPD